MDETNALLREIRDLMAENRQTYKNYLDQQEAMSARARQQSITTRALQWGSLFFVVYAAMCLALKTVQ
jgi:hypothetical protein